MSLTPTIASEAQSGSTFLWEPSLMLPAPYDIFWSLVALVILLVFFWKYALPKLDEVLTRRAQQIEGGIARAEKVQAEADARKGEYEELLAKARSDAAAIRDKARDEAEQIKKEKREETEREIARLTESAKAQIEAERQSAVVSLRREVGSLAIDLASGVVGESLADDRRSQAYVDRFLAELDADSPAGTAN